MIKINKTLFIIGIIVVIILSVVFTIVDKNHIDKLNSDYSISIAETANENSLIIDKKDWHGAYFITLKNKKKYWIDDSRNYKYINYDIEDYLEIGNIIIKKEGIDSLWIESPEGTFVFVVGESINKDKR